MAIVNGYATYPEIRGHVGDPAAALSQAEVERLVESASRAIDRVTGRRFWLDPAATSRVYRPRWSDRLSVDDIGSLTGLVVDTDDTGSGTFGTTWATTDVDLEPRNADRPERSWTRLTVVGDRVFPVHANRATVRVTARFGWTVVPQEIRTATILKVAGIAARKTSPLGIAGFDGFGPVRISRFGDPDVWAALEPFVRFMSPDN